MDDFNRQSGVSRMLASLLFAAALLGALAVVFGR